MASDRKSTIGNFNATPTKEDAVQITVYEKKIATVDIPNIITVANPIQGINDSSIPLESSQHSSMSLSKVEEATIVLSDSGGTSISLPVVQENTISLGEGSTTSIGMQSVDITNIQMSIIDVSSLPMSQIDNMSIPMESNKIINQPMQVLDIVNMPVGEIRNSTIPMETVTKVSNQLSQIDTSSIHLEVTRLVNMPIKSIDTSTMDIGKLDTSTIPIDTAKVVNLGIDITKVNSMSMPDIQSTSIPIKTIVESTIPISTLDIVNMSVGKSTDATQQLVTVTNVTTPIEDPHTTSVKIDSTAMVSKEIQVLVEATIPIGSTNGITSPMKSTEEVSTIMQGTDSTTTMLKSSDVVSNSIEATKSVTSQLDRKDVSLSIDKGKDISTSFESSKGISTIIESSKGISTTIESTKNVSTIIDNGKPTTIPLDRREAILPLDSTKQIVISNIQNSTMNIDLLSMEQFGHNTSLLRKDLAITEADSCNTDTEYGVISCDTSFDLDAVVGYSIVDSADKMFADTDYWIKGYKVNDISIDKSLSEHITSGIAIPYVGYTHYNSSISILYTSANVQHISASGTTANDHYFDSTAHITAGGEDYCPIKAGYIATVNSVAVNVRDYAYIDYFLGTARVSADVSYTRKVIKTFGLDAAKLILSYPENMIEYAYCLAADFATTRSKLIKFYSLLSVSATIFIGIIEREDLTLSIGLKTATNYYTARHDTPCASSVFNLSSLSVVSFSGTSLSFIAIVSGYSRLYSFHCYSDYGAGTLIPRYQELGFYDFYFNDLSSETLEDNSLLNIVETCNMSLDVTIYAINELMYKKLTSKIPLSASKSQSVVMYFTNHGLVDSVTELSGMTKFVASNIVIPFAIGNCISIGQTNSSGMINHHHSYELTYGKSLVHIMSIPALEEVNSTFLSLPLRMQDEYPEIYYRVTICNNVFKLGKTSFVSINGALYGAGGLLLCPNVNDLYVSDIGANLFTLAGYFFLAKVSMTLVYAFTELGMQSIMTIEDEILCQPVKVSQGIILVGRLGIWIMTQSEVRRIWAPDFVPQQVSCKTDLDSSVLVVYSYQGIVPDGSIMFIGDYDNGPVYDADDDGFVICCVSISQLLNVSSKSFQIEEQPIFLRINAVSPLYIIDARVTGASPISFLKKTTATGTFSITSNYNIDAEREPVYRRLIKVMLYAKGSGSISISINSTVLTTITVSGSAFKQYSTTCDFPMDMLTYTITMTSGVSILQRIIGVVSIAKEFYI